MVPDTTLQQSNNHNQQGKQQQEHEGHNKRKEITEEVDVARLRAFVTVRHTIVVVIWFFGWEYNNGRFSLYFYSVTYYFKTNIQMSLLSFILILLSVVCSGAIELCAATVNIIEQSKWNNNGQPYQTYRILYK